MKPPLVLISEPISNEPSSWLGRHCQTRTLKTDDPEFDEVIAQADGLVVRTYTRVDQALLKRAPNLKVVGRAGVGLDNIDLDACTARGVRVVHTPHANAMAVVEYTLSMLMTTLRPIKPIAGPASGDHWHAIRESAITPGSVVGTSLGIIGLGHIGSRVALAAKGLGMDVRFNDLREIDQTEATGTRSDSLEGLLRQNRCVCVHVDGRSENQGLIGEREFAMMRPDVVFLNASRGFVVDPHAAAGFARENPSATLILDVHEPEPIGEDSPMFGLANVILTPHIAAATVQAKTAMSWVVRDVWAVLSGRDPENPAN